MTHLIPFVDFPFQHGHFPWPCLLPGGYTKGWAESDYRTCDLRWNTVVGAHGFHGHGALPTRCSAWMRGVLWDAIGLGGEGPQWNQLNLGKGNDPAKTISKEGVSNNVTSTIVKGGPPLNYIYIYFFFLGGVCFAIVNRKSQLFPKGFCKVLTNPLFSDGLWWDLHWILIGRRGKNAC